MTLAGFIAAVALVVWALVIARGASLVIMAFATLVVGYVFGHAFWHLRIGPLPLTLDRLMLLGLLGLFAWRWRCGKVVASGVAGVDWALGVLLIWLTGSALMSHPGEDASLPTSPYWRLLVAFWVPALLYLIARQAPSNERTRRAALWLVAGLGAYLAVTALAETLGAWSLVFPRYIADPDLGLHFGRARGPMLNSVSLGLHLSVAAWAAWLLLPRASKPLQLLLLIAGPLMALGVFLSYTRSTWMGLAVSGFVVLAAQLPRRLRWPVLGGVAAAGVLLAGVLWQSVLRLEREDSGGVSQHSVQQRTAFAYVSWKMFRDNPVAGVGFGRFYDKKLPYLSDRSQPFELESLRELHHHNTLLSVLVETGVVGLGALLALLTGLLRCGWRLAHAEAASPDERRLGVWLLAAVTVYLPSAVFHDLTLIHSEQWLLMTIAGLAVGCHQRLVLPAAATTRTAEPLRGVNAGGAMPAV